MEKIVEGVIELSFLLSKKVLPLRRLIVVMIASHDVVRHISSSFSGNLSRGDGAERTDLTLSVSHIGGGFKAPVDVCVFGDELTDGSVIDRPTVTADWPRVAPPLRVVDRPLL